MCVRMASFVFTEKKSLRLSRKPFVYRFRQIFDLAATVKTERYIETGIYCVSRCLRCIQRNRAYRLRFAVIWSGGGKGNRIVVYRVLIVIPHWHMETRPKRARIAGSSRSRERPRQTLSSTACLVVVFNWLLSHRALVFVSQQLTLINFDMPLGQSLRNSLCNYIHSFVR